MKIQKNESLEHVVNFVILNVKDIIHNLDTLNTKLSLLLFTIEAKSLIKLLKLIKNNKKHDRFLNIYINTFKGRLPIPD